MARKPKKILFISHEAGLSGATFVLIELMKWLKAHEQIEITILLKEDGLIKNKFEEINSVYMYDFPAREPDSRLYSFIYYRFIFPWQKERHRKKLLRALLGVSFDLIYANTMGVGEILNFLKPLGCKVVSHIHELQYVIECTGAESMRDTTDGTSFYIVVCEEIKNLLMQSYQVDASKILVIPEFVNFGKIDAEKSEFDARQQLNLSPGSFIIGGAGSVEWRKGVDLFVEVAIQVLGRVPTAHFIWVGNPRETGLMAKLNYDIKKAGLEKNIEFVGPHKNPYPYYRMFNLFLLTSREDPYPLVCIENMYLTTPVICFEHSGGAVGLISDYQSGKAVPYLDIAHMAEAVINCIQSRESLFQAVDTERLKEEHSVEIIAPKIFQAISRLM